ASPSRSSRKPLVSLRTGDAPAPGETKRTVRSEKRKPAQKWGTEFLRRRHQRVGHSSVRAGHPSRAGESPWVISVAHHPYSCAALAEARPRRGGGKTARFLKDCRGSLQPRLRMR